MSQEKTTTLSGYNVSTEEIEHLVLGWVKATEAFHYRYARLNQLINTLEGNKPFQTVVRRSKLSRLLELRKQSADILVTLLLDMSDQRSKSQPSKQGRLYSHACLLNEQTKKIDAELINMTTVAQA